MLQHKFEGVKIMSPAVHTDLRGDLWTTYKKDEFMNQLEFNHDKFSTSKKDVIRGIHGDDKSWKLMTCVYGELYFVIIDNRENSETYLEWDSMILNDKNKNMVLIPPKIGNGFLVLSEYSVFSYKWSYYGEYADVDEQFTIKWNDPKFKINWPIKNPILSERDK